MWKGLMIALAITLVFGVTAYTHAQQAPPGGPQGMGRGQRPMGPGGGMMGPMGQQGQPGGHLQMPPMPMRLLRLECRERRLPLEGVRSAREFPVDLSADFGERVLDLPDFGAGGEFRGEVDQKVRRFRGPRRDLRR